MAESSNIPNPVTDTIKWVIVAVVIAGIIAAIVFIVHSINAAAKKAADNNQFNADKAAADKFAADNNLEPGRAEAVMQLANNIYAEMRSTWTSSGTVVSLLNQCQSADEMRALAVFYANNIANGKYTLKSDIDSHVIGSSPWDASAADIKFYSDLT